MVKQKKAISRFKTDSLKKLIPVSKRSQGVLGLSFGVIFSIILIIFFILVAFIAIRAFLGTQKCAQIGIFIDDFQEEINKAWNSQKSSFEFKGRLPSNLEYICFLDLEKSITATGVLGDIGRELGVYGGINANLFLYPTKNSCDMPHHNIKHLDLEKTTSKNPHCIVVDSGRIDIQIEKGFQDALVAVS